MATEAKSNILGITVVAVALYIPNAMVRIKKTGANFNIYRDLKFKRDNIPVIQNYTALMNYQTMAVATG